MCFNRNLVNILYLFLITSYVNCIQNTISVITNIGEIVGRVDNSTGLSTFIGVPYAQPPIGTLRFKKPLPLTNWTEPKEALHWPKPCYQINGLIDNFLNQEWSEDCLYLNIWSPRDVSQPSDQLHPVMLWIHGGALIFGSSVVKYYQGHVLASKGDVVVVTINYRLNAFGFLYTGTNDAPGNMGLWDQVMALQWVNENIRYFGGDPNRVTVFGESAGGWSASLLILSPVSRHLFQNAIMMSGASINRMAGDEPENIIKLWRKGAQAIGCGGGGGTESNENNTRLTTEQIMCLKNAPAHKLANIPNMPETVGGLVGWMSQVVIDQDFLPERPLQMLRKGDFKRNFSLLVGTVEDEYSFELGHVIDHIKYNRLNPQNLSLSEAYSELSHISSILLSKMPINGEEVAELYFTGLSDNNSPDLLRRTIGIAVGDFLLGCPTIQYAKELYERDSNSRVFQYYYTSKLGNRTSKFLCSDWMGACHLDDVFPVFGVPFFRPSEFVDEERDLSERVIHMFSTFAKTGKLPAQNGAKWPHYYTLNGHTITPYYEIGDQKSDTNFGVGLKTNECEYLWKSYIDMQ